MIRALLRLITGRKIPTHLIYLQQCAKPVEKKDDEHEIE